MPGMAYVPIAVATASGSTAFHSRRRRRPTTICTTKKPSIRPSHTIDEPSLTMLCSFFHFAPTRTRTTKKETILIKRDVLCFLKHRNAGLPFISSRIPSRHLLLIRANACQHAERKHSGRIHGKNTQPDCTLYTACSFVINIVRLCWCNYFHGRRCRCCGLPFFTSIPFCINLFLVILVVVVVVLVPATCYCLISIDIIMTSS